MVRPASRNLDATVTNREPTMARPRKPKPAEQSAEKPATDAKPMTLADVSAAINRENQRLSHAENTLALDPSDRAADEVRRDALTKLSALGAERDSLRRIEATRQESATKQAEQARAAADRKIAGSILRLISEDQRKLCKSIKDTLDALARDVTAFDELQRRNESAILSLRDGRRDRIEPLLTASRNVSLTLQIRDAVKALYGTRLLSPWVIFHIPDTPSIQPLHYESHADAKARAQATMSRTIDDVFDDCVERVQGHLNALLGPEPEPTDPADITAWHGRTDADRPDSFMKLLEAGALNMDDSEQKRRQAQRVKDSAIPLKDALPGQAAGSHKRKVEDLI